MKTKITLLMMVVSIMLSNLWATRIVVTSVAEFNSAWTSYVAGDTIQIAEGTYSINATKTISKSVTLMADPAAATMPKLALIMFAYSTASGCNFEINGLDVYWDAVDAVTPTASRYMISATAGVITATDLILKNSVIHGYGRSLLRADNTTNVLTLTNLVVNNTIIHDMGRESLGYSIFAGKALKVSNVNILNSTFYNCKNGPWYSEVTTVPVQFNMENSNMIKCTATGSKVLVNTNANPGSVYTFKNSIISDSYDGTSTNMILKLNSNGSTIIGNIDNTILGNNFGSINGTLTTDTRVAVSALSYDYPSLTIQTTPNTITNIGDPRWSVNPVVASPKTLTVNVSPSGAGTVTTTPNKSTYGEGEEITLSQARNFGYTFKEWQNASGSMLSTNPSFVFNITSDTTIVAVYDLLTTYNFNVEKSGSLWGEVSLSPAPNGGKYESGASVTMSIVPNQVTNFVNWGDGSLESSRVITVDADKNFVANFTEVSFIAGWNFKSQEPRTARVGDFYANDLNKGTISLYNQDGSPINWLSHAGSFSPVYPCTYIWTGSESFATNRRYWQANFSTTGYENITVNSMMAGSYQYYPVQKMQISLDGVDFTDLANVTLSTSAWNALNGTLPVAYEDKSIVYVRWIADITGSPLGSGNDGTALTNIYVFADEISDIGTGLTSNATLSAYGNITQNHINLYNIPENANVEVYSLNGMKSHSLTASGSVTIPAVVHGAIVKIVSAQGTQLIKLIR